MSAAEIAEALDRMWQRAVTRALPDLYAEVYRERYGVYPGVPLEHDDERLWVPWDEIGDVQ